jgi:hypothetical protein
LTLDSKPLLWIQLYDPTIGTLIIFHFHKQSLVVAR